MRLDHSWRPVYSYSWEEFCCLTWAFEKESTWELRCLGIHFLQCGQQGTHYLPGGFRGLPLDFVQFPLPFVPVSVVCKWLPLQPVWTLWLSGVLKASEKHPNLLFSVSFSYRGGTNQCQQFASDTIDSSAKICTQPQAGQQLWLKNWALLFPDHGFMQSTTNHQVHLPPHQTRRPWSGLVKKWALKSTFCFIHRMFKAKQN